MVIPVTCTGVELLVVVPSPRPPFELPPQHCKAPETIAHVCELPVAIAVTPDVRPVTCTGEELAVVVPSPSWPFELLPQHFRALEITAHT